MMEDRISVCLTGLAKIDGRWRKPGEDVAVTAEIALELAEAGAIAKGEALAVAKLAPGMPGYDEAVKAMAKTLADAAVHATVEAATAELIADRDAARARAADAEAEVSRLTARNMELEAEIAEGVSLRKALADEIAALKSADQAGTDEPARPARKKAAAVEQNQG